MEMSDWIAEFERRAKADGEFARRFLQQPNDNVEALAAFAEAEGMPPIPLGVQPLDDADLDQVAGAGAGRGFAFLESGLALMRNIASSVMCGCGGGTECACHACDDHHVAAETTGKLEIAGKTIL